LQRNFLLLYDPLNNAASNLDYILLSKLD